MKIKRTAACLTKVAPQKIHRHAGGAVEWVHLHQNQLHLRPECHPRHLVAVGELQAPKWKVCHPDMCIYIHLFPRLNFAIYMHMPRIASMIKIVFQICWLTKNHPLVSTLSAEWWCSCYPFCRRKQPFEGTWQWRRELIEGNGIFELYHYLQLAVTLKYILKDISIRVIKEQCSDKGERTWT